MQCTHPRTAPRAPQHAVSMQQAVWVRRAAELSAAQVRPADRQASVAALGREREVVMVPLLDEDGMPVPAALTRRAAHFRPLAHCGPLAPHGMAPRGMALRGMALRGMALRGMALRGYAAARATTGKSTAAQCPLAGSAAKADSVRAQ